MAISARDKAEEMFTLLQKRARELLDAEEGLLHMAREALEQRGLQPQEVRKWVEDVLGSIRTRNLWDRLRQSGTVVVLSDYTEEFRGRAEDSRDRLLASLQIASSADVEGLRSDLDDIKKRLEVLAKRATSTAGRTTASATRAKSSRGGRGSSASKSSGSRSRATASRKSAASEAAASQAGAAAKSAG